jgi:hypothetical protein
MWFDGYNTSPTIPSIAELVSIAHSARDGGGGDPVPVLVDAASRLPPVSNLWSMTHAGADCVIFSGGKAIRGPQTSGFLLGRRELIAHARANGSPNEAAVCRPMKVLRLMSPLSYTSTWVPCVGVVWWCGVGEGEGEGRAGARVRFLTLESTAANPRHQKRRWLVLWQRSKHLCSPNCPAPRLAGTLCTHPSL